MKIVKTASGKNRIKMSKREWLEMGKKAGWMKEAQGYDSPEREEIELSGADIEEINKDITEYGDAPHWGWEWAHNNPEKCIKGINGYMNKYGDPPDWCEFWAIDNLHRETEPYVRQIWIPIINEVIEKNGYPPRWANDWAKKKLNEKNPESYVRDIWVPIINKYIKENKYGSPPLWASGWAKNNPEII